MGPRDVGGGANSLRNNGAGGKGKERNKLPISCVPERILGWDLGERRMGRERENAGHPPWKVQMRRIPGVSDPQSALPFQGSPTYPWGTGPVSPEASYPESFLPCFGRTLWVVKYLSN